MANLNIPFVLLNKETCQFRPAINSSQLVHHSKFNLRAVGEPQFGGQKQDQQPGEVDANSGLLSYLGGVLSSAFQGNNDQTISTQQFKSPIQFDETKENLLVLSDEKTGTIALCSHEVHGCEPGITRLMINIQPRVLLIPSIAAAEGQGPGPLVSQCIVRCPAPKILNASTFWLCTLHSDNRLRLWNTDDGRCVSASSQQLLGPLISPTNPDGSKSQKSETSFKQMLALQTIEGFPGHVFVFSDTGDLYIIDVYKMMVHSRVQLESRGFAACEYLANSGTLVFCDAMGTVYICQDSQNAQNNRLRLDEFKPDADGNSSEQAGLGLNRQISEESKLTRQTSSASSQKRTTNQTSISGSTKQIGQKQMLKFCRKELVVNFKFRQTMKIGGIDHLEVGRLKQSQVLAFNFDATAKQVAIVVSQDQIEQVIVNQGQSSGDKPYNRQALKQFTEDNILVFAEFVKSSHHGLKYLVCIDVKCIMHIYDMNVLEEPKINFTEEEKMQFRVNFIQPTKSFNLLDRCNVTDYHQIWIKDNFSEMVSDHKTKEEHLQSRLDRLKEHLLQKFQEMSQLDKNKRADERKRCQLFQYSHEENLLYSFVEVHNKNVLMPQETSLLLSWDFQAILRGELNDIRLPMNINNLSLFGSQSKSSEPNIPNSLINFNSQVLKSFYNSNQFRFFFTDEKVTSTVIFQDQATPSSIIGTNYGRIFMIPMFQEQQFKHVLPTLLIDSHKGNTITKLYMAYQGALWSNEEGGGHLISVSEDGTICATDLKSDMIAAKLYSNGPNKVQTSQKRRTDQFMQEKGKNMRLQRRHSVSQYFSAEDFFHFERVRATEVFEEASFSPIKHIFRIKTFQEAHNYLINAKSRSKSKIELPKQYYAIITEENELLIMAIHPSQQDPPKFKLIKLPLLSEATIGVYLDQVSQSLHILGENMSWRQFCLRSHSLSQRRRTYTDALNMLEIPQLIENLLKSNDHYFRTMHKADNNIFSFQNFQKDFNAKILKGLGTHQCLDFLNLSLSVPLNYAPQQYVLKEQSQQLRRLLALKQDVLIFGENKDSQISMLKAVNQILNWDHDLVMHSDVTRKQSSIITLETQGNHFCGSNQQVLIASTQDMLPVLQSKMKKVKAMRDQPQQILSDYFNKGEESKSQKQAPIRREKTQAGPMLSNPDHGPKLIPTGSNQYQREQADHRPQTTVEQPKQVIGMDKYRWPSKILSLVHPFNLHDGMDESLEEFFNFNMPFLDFRIGIQGIDESFSFIITKEDRNYHNERDHISKIVGLLKMSRQLRKIAKHTQKTLIVENFIEQHIDPQDSTLYLGRFFNSEYWKMSPYLSTIVPAFLLSSFVSIIEYDEKEICLLSQVWLDIVHHIRHANKFKQSCASPLRSPTTLSTSVLSQLLLLQDLNVSSCAKDIIFKPMLCHQSDHDKKELQSEISDWLALVIDTYEELKQETTSKDEGQTGHPNNQPSNSTAHNIMRTESIVPNQQINTYDGAQGNGQQNNPNNLDHNDIGRQGQQSNENRPLSHFFGELEIKGLINVSFYAFYCQVEMNMHLGQRDLDRVSKLVVILIREVVQQFQDRKDYIHLLTILLYLLQCNLKTATANFKRKAIMEDVVRLLLFIFNYYKPPLNRELFITRVTSENFNLIRPTNSELYLKLVAAKTLLEIGVSFTEEFLQLIQFHATTLRPSHEHQKNVLETLRYFINGYGENLEKYLIQIVQILLRCLDPNELALRKNSHKYVSVILSNMVKIFPMVAFHYDTQRLAVGTHDGPIGIYDVRTSAKWKILEGHAKNVTCLCFDSKGNYLASYSAVDLTLKLWKVGNTSFFATIMGGTGRFAKQIKLNNLGSHVANPHVHQQQAPNHIEMENRDRKFQEQNEISRGVTEETSQAPGADSRSSANNGNRISKCNIKFLRNDKDVELIREDGSKELHSLIK